MRPEEVRPEPWTGNPKRRWDNTRRRMEAWGTNAQRSPGNRTPETRNPNPEFRNPKPGTHNPKPKTRIQKKRNPKFETRRHDGTEGGGGGGRGLEKWGMGKQGSDPNLHPET